MKQPPESISFSLTLLAPFFLFVFAFNADAEGHHQLTWNIIPISIVLLYFIMMDELLLLLLLLLI